MLLYAITNRRLLDGDEAAKRDRLVSLASTWASGGVDTIQVREKDLPLAELQPLAARIVAAVRATESKPGRASWSTVPLRSRWMPAPTACISTPMRDPPRFEPRSRPMRASAASR
jgi:hypothetical protein